MSWDGPSISDWFPGPPVLVHTHHPGILGPHCLEELKAIVAMGSTFSALGSEI